MNDTFYKNYKYIKEFIESIEVNPNSDDDLFQLVKDLKYGNTRLEKSIPEYLERYNKEKGKQND